MNGSGHGFAAALAAAVIGAWVAMMGLAAAPPANGGRVVALFLPGDAEEAFAAIIRSGGRPIDGRWTGLLWAVDTDAGGAQRLRAEGAVAVLADLPFAASLGCGGSPRPGTLPRPDLARSLAAR